MARAARTAQMTLRLEVPWRPDAPLQVNFRVSPGNYNALIEGPGAYRGPHLLREGDPFRVRNFFGVSNRVPDVSRYRIHNMRCCERYDDRYRICNNRYIIPRCDVSGEELGPQLQRPQPRPEPEQERIRNIVLLLESPHKDEYTDGDIARPKAPACGETGDNIDRWLGTVLSRTNEDLIEPGCHVIISNPIQFQTSLHAIHGRSVSNSSWDTLRDNVWKTLWHEDHIQGCFLARLTAYNPSLIINACTGDWGCEGADPKGLVDGFVQDRLPNVCRYETYHPARHWRGHHSIIHIRRVNPDPQPNDTR